MTHKIERINGCRVEAFEDEFYFPDEHPEGVDHPVYAVTIMDDISDEMIDYATGFLSIDEAFESGMSVARGY